MATANNQSAYDMTSIPLDEGGLGAARSAASDETFVGLVGKFWRPPIEFTKMSVNGFPNSSDAHPSEIPQKAVTCVVIRARPRWDASSLGYEDSAEPVTRWRQLMKRRGWPGSTKPFEKVIRAIELGRPSARVKTRHICHGTTSGVTVGCGVRRVSSLWSAVPTSATANATNSKWGSAQRLLYMTMNAREGIMTHAFEFQFNEVRRS